MYAKYTYLAGATVTNILTDVVALLTGETVVANLSVACDDANSSIVATVAAGWAVYDATAGTNKQCLRAPNRDTGYKYMVVDTNSAGYLMLTGYESWNAGANTGTDLIANSNSTSYAQRIDTAAGGVIYLSASARHCFAASNTGAGWGSNTGNSPSGIVEMSRDLSFDTTAAGWPRGVFYSPGNSLAFAPRLYKFDLTTVTGGSATLTPVSVGMTSRSSLPSGSSQRIPTPAAGYVVPFFPIIMQSTGLMPAPYGDVSDTCDIWWLPQSMFLGLDEVVKNGQTYVAWRMNATTEHIAIPKG